MWQMVDANLVVLRVVLRLLRRLNDQDDVLETVRAALPQIHNLASRYELITIVGHQEGAGHKLISDGDASALENELARQVIAASPENLADERDLLRLLYAAKEFGADVPTYLRERGTPNLYTATLRDSRMFRRSQTIGSRAERRTAVLSWDALVMLFGSEESLRNAVDQTQSVAGQDEDYSSILELADRYFGGWRPRQFPDDGDD
jgi:hypothetical protein